MIYQVMSRSGLSRLLLRTENKLKALTGLVIQQTLILSTEFTDITPRLI